MKTRLAVMSAIVTAIAAVIGCQDSPPSDFVAEHFKRIIVALDNYCDANGGLPSPTLTDDNGKMLSSWRFRLMPYLEKPFAATRWEEPWDAPSNEYYRSLVNRVFRFSESDDRFSTQVYAITGIDTAFAEANTSCLSELPPDLIVLVEVKESGTHWMEPGDLVMLNGKPQIERGRIGGNTEYGLHVGFADGTIWRLSSETPVQSLTPLFTIQSAQENSREELLAKHRLSDH